MSLPTLTTPGASYRGAWRAQDANVDGSNFVIDIPSLVGGSGATVTARWYNGSVVADAPTTNCALNATAIDSGPGIVTAGNASVYTTDATILSTCEGSTLWESFIRGNWNTGAQFSAMCGFEAWVQNECAYLENGGDGSPSAYIQLDRGSSRSQRGATGFTTTTNNFNVQCDTDNDLNAYINGSGTSDVTLSFSAPLAPGVLSAYEIGPLQRTASAAFPPGIWQYPGSVWTWSRHVLVSTPTSFLNSTDRANLLSWIGGTDFLLQKNVFFFGMCR